MELFKRLKQPTPKFFNRLAYIGGLLLTVGGAIVAWPVALPVAVVTIGGHLVAVGTTVIAVAKLTVKDPEKLNENQ